MKIEADGWVTGLRRIPSPNYDARPAGSRVDLLVIHAISLPPEQFHGDAVAQLFTNTLDCDAQPYYDGLRSLRVSAHFFIRRDGETIQFVSCLARAWHAGVSSWQGRSRCNDFSIGIELEGSDHAAFSPAQYSALHALLTLLRQHYPQAAIAGHQHIAPGRKTDPGPYFDWRACLPAWAAT